ncbi:MAG: hypothetical protein ACI9K2_006553 [Myxococcota bacterium]|jgi:hypothetical protein
MLLWLLGVALAQENVTAPVAADLNSIEEVIVIGDPFARWDGTRWYVATEIITPLGLQLQRDENDQFWSHAFQLRSVFACEKDYKLGAKRFEVHCTIEDIGIQAHSRQRTVKEAQRAQVQRVLDELDAKLTGVDIQLQVKDDGSVSNVDIEGLSRSNRREGLIAETLRQLVARMALGFHMRIPDGAEKAGKWAEYKSALMSMPSIQSSNANSTVMHFVNPYKGQRLVQTVGEGMVSVPIPVTAAQDQGNGLSTGSQVDREAAPTMSSGVAGSGSGNMLDVPATYDLRSGCGRSTAP